MAEQFTFERSEQLNAAITAWAEKLRSAARADAPASSGELRRSIKRSFQKDSGQICRVSVGFGKEGAYIHVGAGRGYAGFKGGTFYSSARRARVKVSPRSIGRMGTGARPAHRWLTPHIERLLPELAQIIQKYQTDAWIKSKGFSTTIKL